MPVEYLPHPQLIARIAALVQRHPEADVGFSADGADCFFALSIRHPRALPALEAALNVLEGKAPAPAPEDGLIRARAMLTYHQEAWSEGFACGQERALDDAFEKAQKTRDPELLTRVLNRMEQLEAEGRGR